MNLDWNALGAVVGSWILTYLLHATVLLSGAALAAVALRARPELEEAIWKLALVGGLLTAALQPAVAGWRAAQPVAGEPVVVAAPASPTNGGPAAILSMIPESGPAVPALGPNGAWRRWVLIGWASVALLLLARLLTASLRLRRRLAGRRPIAGPLARLVDRLLEAAGRRRSVRLTRTDGVPVPIALGGEICMPERALRELPPHEQETVVAHELAHVLRRDPAWLLAGRVLGALFFFHPLVLLAGRRLRRVAELRCDDWAAAATGQPLALARCLTRVAGWGGETVPAAAMAGDPRWLTGRVTRLLDRDRREPPMSAPRWLRPAAAVALVALALWLPGVSLASDTANQAEVAPVAPRPAVAPLPPDPVPAPVVAPGPAPMAVPAPAVSPWPVVAPQPPVRPAFAIPAPGPLTEAELAELEAVVAAELAGLEDRLAAAEHEATAALAEAHRRDVKADVDHERDRARVERQGSVSVEQRRELAELARRVAEQERQAERARREEFERERLRVRSSEREELRRLAEELAVQRGLMAEELAAQRSALVEEARRMAEEARGRAVEMETRQEQQHELARQLAEEAERAHLQARQEIEQLAPELERLRDELRVRTDEREQLRRELEILRRELETLRRKDD